MYVFYVPRYFSILESDISIIRARLSAGGVVPGEFIFAFRAAATRRGNELATS